MNKYLVITGGSRGIGEKTIICFLEQGWQVINISRSACDVPRVKHIEIDLSSAKNVELNAEKLRALLQSPSQICLVHNAAFYKKDSVDNLLLANLQTTLEVNLLSPAALNAVFLPLMLPNSSIIYIGSTLATKAVPGSASYIISKHALIGLMKASCVDLVNRQIHTCCICPGLVDTLLLKEAVDESVVKEILNTEVMGKRLIAPQEIANVVYFCAATPVINGAIIHANLGQPAD